MNDAGPLPSISERIANLDVLRGIAVCMILPVNILVMGTVGDREGLVYPSRWDLNRILWCIEQVLFEGPARGLFTLLFGAGMVLMLKRAEGKNPQIEPVDAWSRRCLILLGLGIIQFAVFMWPGEILWTYGISGLALLAFRKSSTRAVWIWAAILLLGLSGLRAYSTYQAVEIYAGAVRAETVKASGHTLTSEQQSVLDAVSNAHGSLYPSQTSLNEEIQQRTHLSSLLAWSADGWVSRHLSTWSWPGVVECLSFMLIGVGLFRNGFLTAKSQTKTYLTVCVICYGIGLSLRIAWIAWLARSGFEVVPRFIVPEISTIRSFLYEPARLLVTLGHISLITLIFRFQVLGQAKTLRSLGQMSLTTYSLQSIITSLLFYACGMLGMMSFSELMVTSLAIWIATAIFSLLWLRKFPIGPAEWLIRAGAYGRWKALTIRMPW